MRAVGIIPSSPSFRQSSLKSRKGHELSRGGLACTQAAQQLLRRLSISTLCQQIGHKPKVIRISAQFQGPSRRISSIDKGPVLDQQFRQLALRASMQGIQGDRMLLQVQGFCDPAAGLEQIDQRIDDKRILWGKVFQDS